MCASCSQDTIKVIGNFLAIILIFYLNFRPICLAMLAAYPGILFGGGVSTNSVEDKGQRERGSGGGSPLVRSSGGSCNLVQDGPHIGPKHVVVYLLYC